MLINLIRITHNVDSECLPPTETADIFSYLVVGRSAYTYEQFKP